MKYRKKPVTIEAMQWTGTEVCKVELWRFAKGKWFIDENDNLIIRTLEGNLKANVGDYIIKGVKGEIYPCKPDVFERTYEKV